MQSKLTLRLDSDLIEHAKKHAEKMGKSLSHLVATYFYLVDKHLPKSKTKETELPPMTRALKGALKQSKGTTKDYHRYLESKYR